MIFIQGILIFFLGTLVFDIVHFYFHCFLKSDNKWLRLLGQIHGSHHKFFPASLKINKEWTAFNMLDHVVLEYLVQVCTSLLCLPFTSVYAVAIAVSLQTSLVLLVILQKGCDLHHRPYDKLPSYRGGLFVSADYHALHHVYPHHFFSGYLKLFDYIFGTAQPLQGKRIALTGASGALGSHMKRFLEKEGAIVIPLKYGVDYEYDRYEPLESTLANADILFLCHGSKLDKAQQANCDSFVAIIDLFRRTHPDNRLPLEIWAVGSEIECHPCFGIKKLYPYANSKRAYAKYARQYYRERDIQYRHIVHAAFTSRMGPGLMSAKFAAWLTLFFLKRGFKYIPVTYTGFAYLNFFRFRFNF